MSGAAAALEIRAQVLRLLSLRPMTTTELLVKGSLSPAVACIELKQMRALGLISSGSRGREVLHSLAGSVALRPSR